MSAESFIGSVKVKRDEAVEYFMSEEFHQGLANGVESPEVVIQRGVDKLVGGVLDVLNEQYEDIIEVVECSADDELIMVAQIASDLSSMYFEEVST